MEIWETVGVTLPAILAFGLLEDFSCMTEVHLQLVERLGHSNPAHALYSPDLLSAGPLGS